MDPRLELDREYCAQGVGRLSAETDMAIAAKRTNTNFAIIFAGVERARLLEGLEETEIGRAHV